MQKENYEREDEQIFSHGQEEKMAITPIPEVILREQSNETVQRLSKLSGTPNQLLDGDYILSTTQNDRSPYDNCTLPFDAALKKSNQ